MNRLLILLMAAAVPAMTEIMDGDPAFYRVDTRTPANELKPGVLADAVNKMLPDGRAWPRWSVNRQPWGVPNPPVNLIPPGSVYRDAFNSPNCVLNGILVAGKQYTLTLPNPSLIYEVLLLNEGIPLLEAYIPGGTPYTFAALGDGISIATTVPVGTPVVGTLYAVLPPRGFNVCGYARFEDPAGFDTAILLTDDWRNQAGEDGGRGRAWRLIAGNGPLEIPMNGNDIYGPARLIPCLQGVVMLRQQLERHYFAAAAVLGAGANTIQLNCQPDWEDGDEVYLWGDANSTFQGGTGVLANTLWYVKAAANNQVKLYADQGMTQQATWTGAVGQFYLERRSAQPGFYGNGAPPLLAAPDLDNNPWNITGFKSVPVQIYATAYNNATGVLTCLNHNFTPGQGVKYWNVHSAAFTAYFVYVVDANHIELMVAQADAENGVNPAAIANWGATDYVMNATASGQPMPSGREGAFIGQRLVIVNGQNNVVISDPNDVLHYTLLNGITANVGTGGQTNAVATVSSQDTLIILNNNAVLALYNFSEGPANWVLREITREYGCVAPLSVVQRGVDTMFLSRRGWDRVFETAFGVIQPVVKPVSFDMDKYMQLVDWANAGLTTAAQVDNRLLVAMPQKEQAAAAVQNNMWWSLNLLNSDPSRDAWAWEGSWSGAYLNAYAFCVLTVAGKEWITFADYSGNVNWLGSGWLDLGLYPINDSMTTRIYTGDVAQLKAERKVWMRAKAIWDVNNAQISVTAVTPGYNERTALLPNPVSYDRTKYIAGEGPDYNPATQQPAFGAPYRQDYSLAGPGELIGGLPDVHQNVPETFYLRANDWGLQLVIANARGSARVGQITVKAAPGLRIGSRTA